MRLDAEPECVIYEAVAGEFQCIEGNIERVRHKGTGEGADGFEADARGCIGNGFSESGIEGFGLDEMVRIDE